MKVKICYLPEFCTDKKEGYPKEPARLPLVSLPVIKSFLEKYGFKVSQDDLDIKVFNSSKQSGHPVDMSLFDDPARIAGYIRTGNDEQLEEHALRILSLTDWKGYDIFACAPISCWTLAPLGAAIVMSGIIREKYDIPIILGGALFKESIAGVPIAKTGCFDIICFTNHYEFCKLLLYLDGRMPKKELCSEIIFNREFSPDQKETIKGYPATHKDPEVLFPVPDFDGLPLDLYRYVPQDILDNGISQKKLLVLPYFHIYGCPNKCIFCKDSHINHFFVKDPEQVADDLTYLSRKYRTRCFVFSNTSINPTYRHALDFADTIIRKNLDLLWFDCATFNNLDAKLLSKLHQSGARRLVYGLECASPAMQGFLEKNVVLPDAQAVLTAAHKLGIWNEIEVICGLPHEKDSDLKASLDFLRRNKQTINFFYLTKFYLTGSRMLQNPARYGIANIRPAGNGEGMAFDEIDGLKWKDKKMQQDASYRTYEQLRRDVISPGLDLSAMHFYKLFYLYTVFDSKSEIMDYVSANGWGL
ncbi:MAG: radical SAM protein [archaeon]